MTRYEHRLLSSDDGVYSVAGRIVEVLEAPRGGRNQITALVEVDGEATPTAPAAGDVTEGVTVYCEGTTADDEPCSREVDAPGERCFQHPEDEDDE